MEQIGKILECVFAYFCNTIHDVEGTTKEIYDKLNPLHAMIVHTV